MDNTKVNSTNRCCGSSSISMRIRIHHFTSMRMRIRGFDDQKLTNFTIEKKIRTFFFFNCARRASKLQERPSALNREHQALQNMKIRNFFFFSCVIFALLDPDPVDQNQCGSRIRLTKSPTRFRLTKSPTRIRLTKSPTRIRLTKSPKTGYRYRYRNYGTDMCSSRNYCRGRGQHSLFPTVLYRT